ncbi:hypothetical protein [Bacillus sp. 3255]|nr:hypothetical protein [Bacillus sp. 3255]
MWESWKSGAENRRTGESENRRIGGAGKSGSREAGNAKELALFPEL